MPANELWEALKQRFVGSIANQRADLWKEYHGLAQGPSETIAAYFNRARTMRLQLLGMVEEEEKPIYKDELLVEILTAGLAPAFKTAQAQLRLDRAKKDSKPLSVPELEAFLLQAESDMQKAETAQTALFVRGGARGGAYRPAPPANPHADKQCYRCKQWGHIEAHCRQPPSEDQGGSGGQGRSSGRGGKGSSGGDRGWGRGNGGSSSRGGGGRRQDYRGTTSGKAHSGGSDDGRDPITISLAGLSATGVPAAVRGQWILDGRASKSCTYDEDDLKDYEPVHDSPPVVVGDRSEHKVVGQGWVYMAGEGESWRVRVLHVPTLGFKLLSEQQLLDGLWSARCTGRRLNPA